jgi:hypothetical protein
VQRPDQSLLLVRRPSLVAPLEVVKDGSVRIIHVSLSEEKANYKTIWWKSSRIGALSRHALRQILPQFDKDTPISQPPKPIL